MSVFTRISKYIYVQWFRTIVFFFFLLFPIFTRFRRRRRRRHIIDYYCPFGELNTTTKDIGESNKKKKEGKWKIRLKVKFCDNSEWVISKTFIGRRKYNRYENGKSERTAFLPPWQSPPRTTAETELFQSEPYISSVTFYLLRYPRPITIRFIHVNVYLPIFTIIRISAFTNKSF